MISLGDIIGGESVVEIRAPKGHCSTSTPFKIPFVLNRCYPLQTSPFPLTSSIDLDDEMIGVVGEMDFGVIVNR